MVLDIHFYFNILGSEATSLIDVGRSMLDVHFFLVPTQERGNEEKP